MVKCIGEHSVDLSLINRSSKVLDLGCRALSWSKAMLHYVDEVYCVDADNDVKSFDSRLPVLNVAVSDIGDNVVNFIKYGNGTGNHIDTYGKKPDRHTVQLADTMTVFDIMNLAFKIDFIDLIKFDIEGSEIPILLSLEKPPAKQLTIEYHLHTGSTRNQVDACHKHLKSLGYEMVFQDFGEKHGCGVNFWDVLYILK